MFETLYFMGAADKARVGQHEDRCDVLGTEMQVLNISTFKFYAGFNCWFCSS
jgi:hypothetical protein